MENRQMKISEREYLTISQVAEYLNIGRTSVWRYSKQNLLHPHKIGGRILYNRAEIDACMMKGGEK